ncbi:hypothetical protein [Hydrogenophaga sp. PAMC20947]|uniref:hypothetical protein n=1 Tax=Hydrogenophaga sp. PAMC20947 TaxID=2565558 RepID=UPI00109E0B85|nr:hypothetical protein [Hydrogenophaga sp. PAMC20947]QCB47798.1 hypothetical protein E5678_18235 [Hydrogenophaga sp. PAMC20947]
MKKALILNTAIALALAAPLLASAESRLVIGNGNAAAKLDFRVVVPRVLFLAVGTGASGFARNTKVDMLTFNYASAAAAATLGNKTASTAQNVSVKVLGNNGQIEIGAVGSNVEGLVGATTGDTIPWAEIIAKSDDATNFDVPAVGGSAKPTISSGSKVTLHQTTWKYSYANNTVPASGTYNGTVTYTATMP